MTVLVVAPSAWHIAAFTGAALLTWAGEGRPTVVAAPDQDGESARLTEVAGLLGSRAEPIRWPETAWSSDDEGRMLLTELIRTVEPSLVVTPSTTAYGPRSRAIGAMAFDAAFCATVPHYRTPQQVPAGGSRTAIVELDDPFGGLSAPAEYLDAGPLWAAKERAVAAAGSWQPGEEFPEACGQSPATVAEIVSRARGVQIQSEHGEAYTQVRVYGRMRAQRLMPQ